MFVLGEEDFRCFEGPSDYLKSKAILSNEGALYCGSEFNQWVLSTTKTYPSFKYLRFQWHFKREWSITTCWAAFQGLDLRFTTNSFWRVGTKVAHFKNLETLQNVRLSFYTTTILITYILILNVHMQDGAGHVDSEFEMKTAGWPLFMLWISGWISVLRCGAFCAGRLVKKL